MRHRNLILSTRSNVIQPIDTVLHHTPVTFDIHLSEIIGTLIVGGQVTLLHPNGNLDMNHFSKTISHQQVTCLNIAPSFLTMIIGHLCNVDNKDPFENTSLCSVSR